MGWLFFIYLIPVVVLWAVRKNCVVRRKKKIKELIRELQICEKEVEEETEFEQSIESLYEKEKKVKACCEKGKSVKNIVYGMKKTEDALRKWEYATAISTEISIGFYAVICLPFGGGWWSVAFILSIGVTILNCTIAWEKYLELVEKLGE